MAKQDDTSAESPRGEIVLYRTEDGRARIECRFEDESLWLTQRLMANLFQVSLPTVIEHLSGIYEDGELDREATTRKFLVVQMEGVRSVQRFVDHYNLDAILAVGYRVRSARGTAFRQVILAFLPTRFVAVPLFCHLSLSPVVAERPLHIGRRRRIAAEHRI